MAEQMAGDWVEIEGARGAKIASIYSAHSDELMRFAAVLVGRDEAADLVSTAVARCLAARDWSKLENPKAYLFQAVYREAVSIRRRFVRRSAAPLHTLLAEETTMDTHADPSVLAAITLLPVRQRAVILLTYWDDKPVEQVARDLGISDGSVRKHLARARASLREVLA